MLSRGVSFMSQLIRNLVLFISQICHVPKWLRLNCKGSATSSRRFRDTRDDFATILRGILSNKIFEHVQNFRDYFAPLGDTCEEITNHWRLFRDCFATHSRCLSPVVAVQWDRGFTSSFSFPRLKSTRSNKRAQRTKTSLTSVALPYWRAIEGPKHEVTCQNAKLWAQCILFLFAAR